MRPRLSIILSALLLAGQAIAAAFDLPSLQQARVMKAAAVALETKPVSITSSPAKLSEGGPNDFYSNGDYWWPDPSKPNGLPYIRRDGATNPENFSQHRLAMKVLRDNVAALAAAYKLTKEEKYAAKAMEFLDVFLLDPKTRMNPNLNFAQAIPGVSPGRGIGVIDTLHLIEIPPAIRALNGSQALTAAKQTALVAWFQELGTWMQSSKNGKEEAAAKNNHAVAFFLQLAVYADFTHDQTALTECRRQFKEVFLPKQMAADGSFPLELGRTKPYGYSIFQLDNITTLCLVLSNSGESLWDFKLADGRTIGRGAEYLTPYIRDKSKWPLKPDVQAWEGWPARPIYLLFNGLALNKPEYLELWKTLDEEPTDPEVQRNRAITQPLLWCK